MLASAIALGSENAESRAAESWTPDAEQPLWDVIWRAKSKGKGGADDAELAREIGALLAAGADANQPLARAEGPVGEATAIQLGRWVGDPPLIGALENQWPLVARALLENGANPEGKSRIFGCAINVAAHRCPAVIPALIKAGAHPDGNAQGKSASEGSSPLHAVATGGHIEALDALLEAGAHLDGGFARGHCVTLFVAMRGQWEALCRLLRHPEGALRNRRPAEMTNTIQDLYAAGVLEKTFEAAAQLRAEGRDFFSTAELLGRVMRDRPAIPFSLGMSWADKEDRKEREAQNGKKRAAQTMPPLTENWFDFILREHMGAKLESKERFRELLAQAGQGEQKAAWAAFVAELEAEKIRAAMSESHRGAGDKAIGLGEQAPAMASAAGARRL